MLPLLVLDMPVAAKSASDRVWYRAKITELLSPDHVEVLYVDYGREEILPIANIHKLVQRFLSLPVQV